MAFPIDWGRRCALVIQSGQVTDNEVNFPLLVTEDTLPSEIFDADGSYPALNGGGDIRFSSDEAGNTQLACEIEKFVTDNDPANGKAAIWVKVPSLSSSSNTTIYIWYHKSGESQPAEDNAYGKENVWDSNFVMVQHMNQIPDGTADEIVDSTQYDNDGTTSGMDSANQVAGQIDGSLDFDGENDYVGVGDDLFETYNIGSIGIWLKTTAVGRSFISFVDQTSGTNLMQLRQSSGGEVGFQFYSNSRNDFIKTTALFNNDEWHYAIVTCDGNIYKIYVDGVSQALSVGAGSNSGYWWNDLAGGTHKTEIGRQNRANPDKMLFNGTIDEVRISNVARLAGWIATEYNNQYAPGTFLIEGTPETPDAGIEVSATTDALSLTENVANVNAETSISAGVDALVITEAVATIEVGLNIQAEADALVLTENPATVNAEISISAEVDALVLTENAADVNLNVNVSTGVDTLIIAENAANINAEVNISAGIDALALTEYQAVVDVDEAIEVIADIDALTLTEYAATVNAEVSISAEIDILTLIENVATVNAETNISASIDMLAFSSFAADIKIDIDIQATLETLVIAEYSASVATEAGSTKFISEQLGLNQIQGLF